MVIQLTQQISPHAFESAALRTLSEALAGFAPAALALRFNRGRVDRLPAAGEDDGVSFLENKAFSLHSASPLFIGTQSNYRVLVRDIRVMFDHFEDEIDIKQVLIPFDFRGSHHKADSLVIEKRFLILEIARR